MFFLKICNFVSLNIKTIKIISIRYWIKKTRVFYNNIKKCIISNKNK